MEQETARSGAEDEERGEGLIAAQEERKTMDAEIGWGPTGIG